MKPKIIFLIDQHNDLIDIKSMTPNNLPSNLVISWVNTIPHPGKNPAEFDAWLKAWHKQHNGPKTRIKQRRQAS